jgi:energy-converting hydrogenase Eha subunit A
MIGNESLRKIAKELFWWQTPEVSLANSRRFVMQVMALGTWDEVQQVEQVLGWASFKDALLNAQAGVLDARSWAYWRAFFGLPEAEMPRRSLK